MTVKSRKNGVSKIKVDIEIDWTYSPIKICLKQTKINYFTGAVFIEFSQP